MAALGINHSFVAKDEVSVYNNWLHLALRPLAYTYKRIVIYVIL